LHEAAAAQVMDAESEIEPLEYPVCPGTPALPAWDAWPEAEEGTADGTDDRAKATRSGAKGAEPDESIAEVTRRAFAEGRERGLQEGRDAEREAHAAMQREKGERWKRELAAVIASIGQDRDRFLHAVEREVVKLSLAIAARILRREAQVDPLLLAGAVRVALGQLAGSTEVMLRVPAAELELWRETIAVMPHLATKPVVIAGEGMRLGDCVIESKVGSVDLGVRSQLGEMEREFFDRPEPVAANGLETGDLATRDAEFETVQQ
jgi:flagellar assembly protein FliH